MFRGQQKKPNLDGFGFSFDLTSLATTQWRTGTIIQKLSRSQPMWDELRDVWEEFLLVRCCADSTRAPLALGVLLDSFTRLRSRSTAKRNSPLVAALEKYSVACIFLRRGSSNTLYSFFPESVFSIAKEAAIGIDQHDA
jgi:hypothetical protein